MVHKQSGEMKATLTEALTKSGKELQVFAGNTGFG